MRTSLGSAERPARARSPVGAELLLGAAALTAALAVGVLAAHDPLLAVAAAAAAVAIPLAVLRPTLITSVLMFSVFAEAITVGGTTVGRLTAPLALVAVTSQVLHAPVRLRGAALSLGLIAGYVLLAVASLIWTVNVPGTMDALSTLMVSLVYMAAFAALIRGQKDLQRLLAAVAVSSVALAVLWIGQYAIGVDRRFNVAGDPNFFAAAQVVALPLVVVRLSLEADAARRLFLYLAIAVIAASVLSTVSRGGFVTLAIVVLLIVLLPSRLLFPSARQKAAFLLTALIGLGVLFPFAWGELRDRFEVGFSRSNVAGGRGDLWMAAATGYRLHPLSGLGFGAFKPVSFELLRNTPGVELEEHLRSSVRSGQYVHNAFLGSLAELGPLGLALFVGVLGASAARFRRAAREARAAGLPMVRAVANALLLGLVGLVLTSLLLSTETSRVLWVLVGLSLSLPALIPLQGPPGHAET